MISLYQAFLQGANVKQYLLELHQVNNSRDTEALDLSGIEVISALPTVEMPSFPKSPPIESDCELISRILVPHEMSVDGEGRMCLRMIDAEVGTMEMATQAVEAFRRLTGVYPGEIVLCPSRFARLLNRECFVHEKGTIPFVTDFDRPLDYDILARGYVAK